MGPSQVKWFVPVLNSVGNGLSFPISEDVWRALRGLHAEEEHGDSDYGDGREDDEDRMFRRDESGRWMVHD